jgi:hypothetical protein
MNRAVRDLWTGSLFNRLPLVTDDASVQVEAMVCRSPLLSCSDVAVVVVVLHCGECRSGTSGALKCRRRQRRRRERNKCRSRVSRAFVVKTEKEKWRSFVNDNGRWSWRSTCYLNAYLTHASLVDGSSVLEWSDVRSLDSFWYEPDFVFRLRRRLRFVRRIGGNCTFSIGFDTWHLTVGSTCCESPFDSSWHFVSSDTVGLWSDVGTLVIWYFWSTSKTHFSTERWMRSSSARIQSGEHIAEDDTLARYCKECRLFCVICDVWRLDRRRFDTVWMKDNGNVSRNEGWQRVTSKFFFIQNDWIQKMKDDFKARSLIVIMLH